ncbi:TenA family protein [Rhodococcus sp. NPDC049939]|uniref:TenA family protein n=1 Tax=Rhodococcus sp. NPDC049939 TaxID=3155511 RepID=UPI0033E71AE0
MTDSAHVAAAGEHTRFTDHLWDRIKVLRDAIDELEFLRRLGDGTLPLDAFRTYIEQDFLYLTGYAKALSLVAAHAPDPDTAGFWAGSAATAATVEASLHKNLLTSGQLPESDTQPQHSQACLGYVSYLTAVAATEPYPVAAAAMLPCFWIYADVGRRLARSAREVLSADPSHPYAQWVTTYDAEEFQAAVATAREMVDAAAATATGPQREAMVDAFVIASRYELMFWDTVVNKQEWPAS